MTQQDTIENIGNGSLIQHGKHNQRVYLMKLNEADTPAIMDTITQLARKNNYSKIFCKVPQHVAPQFIARGFLCEAQIPRFYNNRETVFFMSKFLNSDRLLNMETEQLMAFSKMLQAQNNTEIADIQHDTTFRIKRLTPQNSRKIAEIYRKVFESYPFPVFDPEYITETMSTHVAYFGIEANEQLVALASSEIDRDGQNAEMTDFATLPAYRGKKLSVLLLQEMERHMQKQGIKTLYTIARLNSVGMNKTFLRTGYTYSGTAVKNTNIAGTIESMNIYYKHI